MSMHVGVEWTEVSRYAVRLARSSQQVLSYGEFYSVSLVIGLQVGVDINIVTPGVCCDCTVSTAFVTVTRDLIA
jgi:hypothetical protein